MSNDVKIGTCGFRANKTEYAGLLHAVEVQHTFYQPPQIKTLEKWRRDEVPADFEFALKVWQLVTHESKSPTYKRLKKQLTDRERDEAGAFRPTAIVREAWETTRASAAALGARTVLFQCPASFKPTAENVANFERFMAETDRGGLDFAWEPRGAAWTPTLVKGLCETHRLRHAVDPFATATTTPEKVYFRLHGRTGFRYKYEEDELSDLAELLPKSGDAYVFFNNRWMLEDALQFRRILESARKGA